MVPNSETKYLLREPRFYEMTFMPETQFFRPQNSTMLHTSQIDHATTAGGLIDYSQSQGTANNLSGPLIPNKLPAASTLQSEQFQAQTPISTNKSTSQTLMQNKINLLALQAVDNPSAQLSRATTLLPNLPAREKTNHSQSQVIANNLRADSIPNRQPAAASQLQQFQAQTSFSNNAATATLAQNLINLLALKAIDNQSEKLSGASASLPNHPNMPSVCAAGVESFHETQQPKTAPPKISETAAAGLLDQLNALFPNLQRSSTVVTQSLIHTAHRPQNLNILRLLQDLLLPQPHASSAAEPNSNESLCLPRGSK